MRLYKTRTQSRHSSHFLFAAFLVMLLSFGLGFLRPASAQSDFHDLRSIKRITDYWLSREGHEVNPLLLGTQEEYLNALRRMRAGESRIVGGAELPTADAEIRASECTSCKLILESIAFFQHSLDELKTEAATLRAASVASPSEEDTQDLAEAENGIEEMEAHLRTLSMQAARCWDECVPPDQATDLFIPTPFEFPISIYPGEPVTCLACQSLVDELRKVNQELVAAQKELDELEALDLYYRSRFAMWDVWIEDADIEGLKAMRALADARARLMATEPTGADRTMRQSPRRGPLPDYMYPKGWEDLNRADNIGGRAVIMMEWSYDWIRRQAFKARNLPDTLPADVENTVSLFEGEIAAAKSLSTLAPSLTSATFYSWLYGAPFQTSEEVKQGEAPNEMSAAQKAVLERLVINAAIALAEKLPPLRARVEDLRMQRRDILARIFDCHRRLCKPDGTGSGLPIEPVVPPGVDTTGLTDGSALPPPQEESDPVRDGAGVFEEDPEGGGLPQDRNRTKSDEAKAAPTDGAGSDKAEDATEPSATEPTIGSVSLPQPADILLDDGEENVIVVSEGIRLRPDGTFVDENGALLSPMDLVGLPFAGGPAAAADSEDPETGADDAAEAQAQEDAIAVQLAEATEPAEKIGMRTIQPLPSVPGVAEQCEAAPLASIAACNRLLEPERATCNALAGKRDCLSDLFDDLGGASEVSCLVSCEGSAAHQALNQYILDAGRRLADQNFQQTLAALAVPPDDANRLLSRIAELDATIADMERGRLVHYYENTNTGAVVEHFADRFEPVPPLIYLGEGRLPLNAAERARLADRQSERQNLVEQRTKIVADAQANAERSAELNAWYANALSEVWPMPPSARMWCTQEMAADHYATCRRDCVDLGYRDGQCLSQFSDNFTDLDFYYLNQGIYPPGYERNLE